LAPITAPAADQPGQSQNLQNTMLLNHPIFGALQHQKPLLVGGFKHFLFSIIYGYIWDVILPIDELHHFSRW
jgi:hypothetical protein